MGGQSFEVVCNYNKACHNLSLHFRSGCHIHAMTVVLTGYKLSPGTMSAFTKDFISYIWIRFR